MNISACRLWRMVSAVSLLFGSLSASAQAAPQQDQKITRGVFSRLIGDWNVTGSTLGRPTITGADVHAEFGGAFIEVHIKDPAGKDQYEARIFFGQNKMVAWSFTGWTRLALTHHRHWERAKLRGNVVTIAFPYPEGQFRDTFTYEPASDRWRLFIQMGPADHPKIFSDWYFVRIKH